jgi:hypothetical protein
VTAWARIALGAREPSLSLIVVTEAKVRLTRHKGHDSARVNARLERRVGPDLTEEEVRLMRHKGHDSARVNARLERRVGPDLTEEEVCLTRHEAPIWPEQAHALSVASVLI